MHKSRGAALATVVVVVVLAAGAVGAVTGVVDPVADHPKRSVTATAVSFYRCPGDQALGSFHGGDRVLATGTTRDGDWIEVRNPYDVGSRVWVAAESVEPDATFEDLPVVACRWDVTTETEPRVQEPVPTTTAGEVTTTSSSAPRTTSPTTAPPSPQTTAPDTSDPMVGGVGAVPREIWETGCIDPVATVSATVVDDRDPAPSVTLDWRVGELSGSTAMIGSGTTYTAQVGPFPVGTVPEADSDGRLPVVLTVTARDAAGNTTVRPDLADRLTLSRCD